MKSKSNTNIDDGISYVLGYY